MKLQYGLLGEKLGHSMSPLIHNAIYDIFSINATYSLFEIDKSNLSNFFTTLTNSRINGFNITIPYKIDCIKYLDKISDEAYKIGSVNTVTLNDKKLGYNTDYDGFGYLIDNNNVILKNKTAIILGSGGVSKTVAHYFLNNGIKKIFIATRNIDSCPFTGYSPKVEVLEYNNLSSYGELDIIVNCTPCGMYPNINISPIDLKTMYKFQTVIDLIYNPSETLFLSYAKTASAKSVNGLEMLVAQAVYSYKHWIDLEINSTYIDKICNIVQSKTN